MTAANSKLAKGLGAALTLAGALAFSAGQANAAATIVINNINAAGVGFNDTTAAAPVGGNPGTTLGEQRLFAFTYAANLWGATLTSNQPIIINAQFSALTCTAASAVLGSAGATSVFRNFANAPKIDTWYSYALANKLSGTYLGTPNAPQINANFNVNLGTATCLPGSPFYLGVDGQHGTGIDFVAVLQHEMGHGLGFQTFTSGSTGAVFSGFPSIWDHYLFGVTANKLWKDMTPAERIDSAISLDKLVWTGNGVNGAIPSVLRFGLAGAVISGPSAGAAAGTIRVGEASFGPTLGSAAVVGQIAAVAEQTVGAGQGCEPFDSANAGAVNGKIALISRGVCGFVVKVKNAQNAGAVAVLISDNAIETAIVPSGLGGADPTITIPAVRIFLRDGNNIRESLKKRKGQVGVFASLGLVVAQYAGADPQGRAQMYVPNPFQSGSSVSHFDTTMSRNQLMEPAINGDLTQSLIPPEDLTFRLLQDIGW
jgi:hypothetical protein